MAVPTSAESFLPARMSPPALRKAAEQCRGCDLDKNATQTVFGRGANAARVMLLGELPGDQEDQQGEPFVGQVGRLLDGAIADAGLHRDDVYLTNVVKHFRWEPRGRRRLHTKPTARQIEACRPWLQAEILFALVALDFMRRVSGARASVATPQASEATLVKRILLGTLLLSLGWGVTIFLVDYIWGDAVSLWVGVIFPIVVSSLVALSSVHLIATRPPLDN